MALSREEQSRIDRARHADRLAKGLVPDPAVQSANDRAAHQRRMQPYYERRKQEERKEFLVGLMKFAFWIAVIAVIIGLFWREIEQDAQKRAAYNVLVQAKYAKWNAYKHDNCKVVERMYGISTSSGKFHHNDNATVYECKDGLKHVIAQSTVEAIQDNRGSLERIPDVP